MKTVMKKMFCLLLVAVMLVSAVPVAFAEGTEVKCPRCQSTAELKQAAWRSATCEEPQKDAYECTNSECKYAYAVEVGSPLGHTEVIDEAVAATCTTPGKTEGKHCSVCNEVLVAQTEVPAGHSYGDWQVITEANCTNPGLKTRTCSGCNDVIEEIIPVNSKHDYSSKGVCNYCKLCKHCNLKDAHKTNCIYYCNGTTSCPNDPTDPKAHNEGCLKTKCNLNGCTKPYGHDGECSVPCTKTPGCVLKQNHTGDCNTPCEFEGCTLGYKHPGDHSNACATCGKPKMKSPEHQENCDYYYLNAEPSNTGNALVRIHVRLHNGDTLIDTVELLSYRDDKGTQIGDSVSAHKSMILAELAEKYPEYSWGGNLYDDPGDSQDYNEQIGTGTTVYINAYAGQDMVLIYVHNSRSFNNLRIIQLQGKRRGDTVTKKDVTDAVSKYYNVSSLAMYSEDAWEDYVDGENVESVSSLKIPKDDAYYVIDVKISGTAKSGSSGSSYTADSSNPKTGDAIFAPVAVLGLSASALAVLFFLNKKRAY